MDSCGVCKTRTIAKRVNIGNPNIHAYPLDVTSIAQCKSVFKDMFHFF